MLRSVLTKPAVAWALAGCSIVLNLVLLFSKGGSATPKAVEKAAAAAKPAPAPVATAPAQPEVPASEWKTLKVALERSPSYSFQKADAEDGDPLSQVYARLFVWDLNLRTELSPGDQMDVAWRWTEENELEIGVARLNAKKKGKTFRAYRWQAPGDTYASYWNENGQEVPLQLKDGPLANYQQITSLLKDRPTHKGMDFKTPVGTEVKSPFAGTVTRSNWNWGANGNCLEVQFADGTLAKFLHLSENRVKAGEKVEPGQVIALSGNTGRSTAPHLHYQLNQGEKVLDPIEYHGTVRRQLDDAAMAQFKPSRDKLDALLADRTAGL